MKCEYKCQYKNRNRLQYAIFFLFVMTTFQSITCYEVQFVFEFSTNGARSPTRLDKNNKDLLGERWAGAGLLTGNGMRQQYSQGSKLRQHYINRFGLLSPSFNAKQLNVSALADNASIISAYSQLLGLYPSPVLKDLSYDNMQPSLPNYDLYNAEEVYKEMEFAPLPQSAQVFPIKTFPPDNKFIGLMDQNKCTGLSAIMEKNAQKPKVRSFVEDFEKKYSKIEKDLKLGESFFNSFNNISHFCEDYLCGVNDNRKFKSLQQLNQTKAVDFNQLKKDCRESAEMELFDIKLGDEEREVVKLTATRIVINLLEQLDEVIEAEKNNRTHTKYEFFFVEEDMASLLAYLRIGLGTDIYFPGPSSVMLFEFIKVGDTPRAQISDENYFVNIYMNKKTLKTINYKSFKQQLIQLEVTSQAINNFCGFTDHINLYFMLAALMLACTFVAIGFWILYIFRHMKRLDEGLVEESNSEVEEEDNRPESVDDDED